MARPKKQVKLKEPIKIRLKSLADGNKSIYLDIYYKGVRKYEYLKLYLVPEINPICKEQNKQTMAVAQRIKAERIKAQSQKEYALMPQQETRQHQVLRIRSAQDWAQKKPVLQEPADPVQIL